MLDPKASLVGDSYSNLKDSLSWGGASPLTCSREGAWGPHTCEDIRAEGRQ